jgi:hypothetical protein
MRFKLPPRDLWKRTCLIFMVLATQFHIRAAEPPGSVQHSTTNNRSAMAKLVQAARAGDPALLRAAIADGGNVNGGEAGGLPPLLMLLGTAAGPLDDAHRQCVTCLLENGAAVDPKDDLGRTPLIHAARLGDLETIKILVDAEAYVKTRDHLHKTALFYAVESNRPDIVRYLATHGDLVSLTTQERKLLGIN